MKDIIEHLGVVENIDGMHVKVRIVQTSACSTCAVKGHCNASERKVKIIDAFNFDSYTLSLGQQVNVFGTTSMGMQAVLWAFGIPFLVLFAMLFVLMGITDNEVVSALGAILALVPYYLIIYAMREKFSKKFTFTIKPINN